MRTCILYYDSCALFEVTIAALFMKHAGEVVTVGPEIRDYESWEGLRVRPHMRLKDLDAENVDLFILPGGDPDNVADDPDLRRTLVALNQKGKVIAAICAGPVILARSGILRGRRYNSSVAEERKSEFAGAIHDDRDVVEDGNIVTALPNAYVDLALTLGKKMNIFEDRADYDETVRIYREFERS
ncbi:MAG: DJ-1/PfpI family protein [Methanomassiliicoccales archaeon]|jgi:putative intracellular protease/amidase